MCGRYALGLGAEQVRLGIANHFPQALDRENRGRPNVAVQRRAQLGQERRERDRVRRERRRAQAQHEVNNEERDVESPPVSDQDREEEPVEEDRPVDPFAGMSQEERTRRLRERAESIPWADEDHWRPNNFNVAPRTNCPIIRLSSTAARLRGGGGEYEEEKPVKKELDVLGNQELVIETMQWGLIPHWSKYAPSAPLNTINARSENLIDNAGGMWQSLKGPKRCIVVVQGYYEWQKKGTNKVPHLTRLPSTSTSSAPNLMLLAGLYDTVKYLDSAPSDPPLRTFTILTTTPSKSLEFLHDRMPCILNGEEEALRWLDCRNGWTGKVASLLRPYDGEVECYPVPKEVGRVGTNSETYIQPVSERKDGIASMFKKQEAKKEVAGSPSSKIMDQKAKLKPEKCDEVHSPVKQEGKDVKGIEGLGDDSNAPQVKEEIKPTGADRKAKRKADPITEDVDAKRQSKKPKPVRVESSDDEIEVVDKEEFHSKTRLVSQRESGRKSRGGAKMVEDKVDAANDEHQTSLDGFIKHDA